MNEFLLVTSISSGNISKEAATQLLISVREENRLFFPLKCTYLCKNVGSYSPETIRHRRCPQKLVEYCAIRSSVLLHNGE